MYKEREIAIKGHLFFPKLPMESLTPPSVSEIGLKKSDNFSFLMFKSILLNINKGEKQILYLQIRCIS